MTLSILLTFALFLFVLSVHLLGAQKAYAMSVDGGLIPLLGFLVALFVLHCLAAGIFAGGFALAEALGLGDFSQEPVMGVMDYYYFSLINITTLGLGDIYPTRDLRFMAGIESLTGFLLISISASYVFRRVHRKP